MMRKKCLNPLAPALSVPSVQPVRATNHSTTHRDHPHEPLGQVFAHSGGEEGQQMSASTGGSPKETHAGRRESWLMLMPKIRPF